MAINLFGENFPRVLAAAAFTSFSFHIFSARVSSFEWDLTIHSPPTVPRNSTRSQSCSPEWEEDKLRLDKENHPIRWMHRCLIQEAKGFIQFWVLDRHKIRRVSVLSNRFQFIPYFQLLSLLIIHSHFVNIRLSMLVVQTERTRNGRVMEFWRSSRRQWYLKKL